MSKLLTIAIPRYRETEQEIFPLLSSISNQIGIDLDEIEVIVVTDGGGGPPLDENFLTLLGFETKQLRLKENKGCGTARQAAIDIARGDYILCCDADDILHNVGALAALMDEAKITSPDILTSDFLEEQLGEDGRWRYLTHGPVGCWMHGKLLRRQFLLENNIRFLDGFTLHEDSYFLCIATALGQRMRHLPVTTYVWRYNPNSITRRNNAVYTYESMPVYVQAITMAWSTVEQLRPEQMRNRVVQFVHYNYFTLHRPDWLVPERKELLEAAEKAFAGMTAPFMHYYFEASPEEIAESYHSERGRLFAGGVEDETVEEWLGRMGLS